MDNLIDITCTKASTDLTTVVRNCDPDKMTLEEFRQKLEQAEFIRQQEDDEQWRFIVSNVVQTGKLKPLYSDRIVGRGNEDVRLKKVLIGNPKREIVITDAARVVSTDLIGYTSNWFAGGNLRVKANLTNSANNKGKFSPIMLTDVISTNENLAVHYPNVCIFCEDSEVSFTLRSFGTLGFLYKATLNSGAVLRESAVRWRENTFDVFGETCFHTWHGSDNTIVMKSIKEVSRIDPATKLSYMEATFRATDMTAWRDWGSTPNIIHRKPQPGTSAFESGSKLLKIGSNIGSNLNLALMINNDQRIVEGSDIRPATPTQGTKASVGYGKWYWEEWKPWEQSQDSLHITFFCFESLETAKKYFDRYNYMPLHEQGIIWEV